MRPSRLLPLVLIAGTALASFLLLPPLPHVLPTEGMHAPVRGAIHVHTRRSDGTGTVDQIAAAAARAGLAFVILTDHGDGTREPERPSYQHGVLCIDAVEISTDDGHVVALGLPRSPYPIGGEARDVVDDIARMGAMSIAAHPTSAKPALRWRDWTLPVAGVEWLNGDSEWRDERFRSLGRAVLTYPVRRAATLATLLDRPEDALAGWDRISTARPVVGLAGSDAHARLGLRGEGDPFEPRIALHIPAYEQVFRTFSNSVTGVSLTHDAAVDAKAIVDGIRHGHLFSSIDGLAGPAIVSFTADTGPTRAQMGDTLPEGTQTTFHVETNAPTNARIYLVKNGAEAAVASAPRLEFVTADPGAYRVEIHLADAPGSPPIPWVVTNPIYLRTEMRPAVEQGSATTYTPRYQDQSSAEGWSVQKNAQSQGAIDVVNTLTGKQLKFRFALGGSEGDSPFVGLAMPTGPIVGSDRLVFTATASRPMRMSVQLRAPAQPEDERWRRSVFVDETPRTFTIRFDDMRPLGSARPHPDIGRVRDVLFVIDQTNARPGSNGQIWIDDVKYGR